MHWREFSYSIRNLVYFKVGVFLVLFFFFFFPVWFPNVYIHLGKRSLTYVWLKPRLGLCAFWPWQQHTVSGFGTRGIKQCHAFVRSAVGTNTGHLMSGFQRGLFEIEPLPVFKVWLRVTTVFTRELCAPVVKWVLYCAPQLYRTKMKLSININKISGPCLTTEMHPSCWSAVTAEAFSNTKERVQPKYV